MDVRCNHCGTEYELDDRRVPLEGLAVKCSGCTHVFRVFRPGAEEAGVEAARTKAAVDWKIRQTNGNVLTFRELTTLQRWIVERKVGREDEISKTGNKWKRLGDIGELAPFFALLEGNTVPLATSAPAPAAAPTSLSGAFPTLREPSPPPPDDEPPERVAAPAPKPRPQVPSARATTKPEPKGRWAGSRDSSRADTDPGLPEGDGDDDEEEETRGEGRSGIGRWVAIGLGALLLVGAGALWVLKPAFLSGLFSPTPALAETHLSTGHEELLRDTDEGILAAIENFEKALSIAPALRPAKAALALALLTKAESSRLDAALLEAGLADQKPDTRLATTDKANNLHKDANGLMERAFAEAKDLLTEHTDDVPGVRAMAEYYRLKTSVTQMQQVLEGVPSEAPADHWLKAIRAAQASIDPASREQAVRLLLEALELSPKFQRARYRLAGVYVATGEKEKALVQLRALLGQEPKHKRAKAMLDGLTAPPPPKVREGPTYSQLIGQAERLRQSDNPQKALVLYDRAKEMKEGIDALLGLGWCYLDLEKLAPAMASFERAILVAPNSADAHMGLAEAYKGRNMKRDAVKHYRRYLELAPEGPDAPVAKRMLTELGQP